jgi:hypothetical protein
MSDIDLNKRYWELLREIYEWTKEELMSLCLGELDIMLRNKAIELRCMNEKCSENTE